MILQTRVFFYRLRVKTYRRTFFTDAPGRILRTFPAILHARKIIQMCDSFARKNKNTDGFTDARIFLQMKSDVASRNHGSRSAAWTKLTNLTKTVRGDPYSII